MYVYIYIYIYICLVLETGPSTAVTGWWVLLPTEQRAARGLAAPPTARSQFSEKASRTRSGRDDEASCLTCS